IRWRSRQGIFRPDEARATSISHSGSVRSEQRSLGEKDLPPSGLRRIWPVASLLVGHSPTAGGCSLLAPRHRPNWAQRTSSDLCLRPLSRKMPDLTKVATKAGDKVFSSADFCNRL